MPLPPRYRNTCLATSVFLTADFDPIAHINVLPAGSSQQLTQPPSNDAMATGPGCIEPIIIDGLLDVAVDEYTEWQQSRVSNEAFRENINKARDMTLENCLDLMQIYEDQDPGFLSTA
ncbi:hypothetical protein DTO027I6_9468 [Penicillium roqueforti]|uniref:uncharacterized protein n=1 Tax=Penicillium roqueforti TaxID=5082 RepID=UPI00190A5C56|nr:uncharacterized protein LCP9604111_3864 [Penicillium roqueforti]KAF9249764.1 hypothetical protein LCP9604111_3864 [Penicillium roqueforti]KAI1829852.1 hypothetical protein CBS147337_9359 [Penicillium roqueforti]KAI3121691.1 hypothetical protein CBS147330_7801 [Penicillium roqueforti]KAI3160874.1 hypothetical protein DTO039G3_8896 [Penicillium roqueforti]KAI3186350.1 hypothetical protein DTO027I6_9468 [Penicillium roqueforti]